MANADETHAGSRWTFPLREGLIAPRHQRAMGEAIWLYLYLHKHANFATGIVPRYNHAVAAAELGVGERTVERWLARLVDAGYVTVTPLWRACTVEILRYTPRPVSPPSGDGPPDMAAHTPDGPPHVAAHIRNGPPDMAVHAPDGGHADGMDRHICRDGPPDMAASTLHSVFTEKDEAAAATRAPTHTHAREGGPDDLVVAVAAAILEAQGRPVGNAAIGRLVPAVVAEVIEPYRGRATLDQARRCLAYLRSKPPFDAKPHILTPKILGEDLGPWIAAGEPATYGHATAAQSGGTKAEPRTVHTCFCGVTLDAGKTHRSRCGLAGIATWENSYLPYRDGPREGVYEPKH